MAPKGGSSGSKRKRPAAWDTTKSEYFVKWDAIKGEQIPKETLEFFIHVNEKLNQPFDDDDDKDLFVQNVFSQTESMESSLVCNSLCSQIVERLIPSVSSSTLLKFAEALAEQLVDLSQDQFASHVMQTLMLSAAVRVQADAEQNAALTTWLLHASDQLLSNIISLSRHQYSSHVVRTCLECLAGWRSPELTRSRRSQQQRWRGKDETDLVLKIENTPEVMVDKLIEMVKAVKNSDALKDSLSDANFSTVVQLVLHILQARAMHNLSHKLLKRLSKLNFGGDGTHVDSVPSVFSDESRLRVLETALATCDEETFGKMFKKYFEGRIVELLGNNLSQISVQRLVEACPTGDILGSILDELEAAGDGPAAWWRNSRLPTALAQACYRLFAHQARFMKMAASVTDCETSDRAGDLSACLLYRTNYAQWQHMQPRLKNLEVPMDGSLLVQAMLKFSKPTRLISSLLSLHCHQLSAILLSPAGSHVIDTLMTSSHMGDKARTKLLENIKDELVSLACSKNGSRALDALWAAGSPAQRTFIAEVLSPQQHELRDNFFGRFAVRNYALPLFAKKRSDWTAYVKREANKRKMFADLLPESTGGSTKQPRPRSAAALPTTLTPGGVQKKFRRAHHTPGAFVKAPSQPSGAVDAVLDDLE